MHRHGYKGRKFGLKTDARRALRRSMEIALIENSSITVTTARAKEIRRETEKLITIAKRGGLANRRLLMSRLNSQSAAALLMDVVAPQVTRDSGYLRIESAGFRRGDNAEMSTISFVDDINYEVKQEEKKVESSKEAAPKETAKKEDK